MLSKLILFLSSVLVLIIIVDHVQNNIVLKLYLKYQVKESEVAEKLLFRNFLKKFNKSYDRNELQMRFRHFKENLLKIEKLNRESRHATYGITKFSDWTKEELAAISIPNVGNCMSQDKTCGNSIRESAETRSNNYSIDCCKDRVSNNTKSPYWWKEKSVKSQNDGKCKCDDRSNTVRNRRIKKIPIPPKVDWREAHAVGPVLYQRRCPACWAISIVGVMESRAFIQNYGFNRLSIQEMLDCSFFRQKDATGCHAGRPVVEALDYLCDKQLKITTEAKYPLTLVEEKCQKTVPGLRGISRFVNSCDMYKNETKLLEALADGPVTALVNSNFLLNYIGGIISENCETTPEKLDHAVQLVGYDRTGSIPYYILKNSWGTDWGEKGYAYLEIGTNQCGIAFSISYFDVN